MKLPPPVIDLFLLLGIAVLVGYALAKALPFMLAVGL